MAGAKRLPKMWVYSPRKPAKPKVPESVKAEVTRRAQAIVDEWKPQYIKEPPKSDRLNYIIDLYTEWRGNNFSFCATYACPGPTAISPSFESRFTRLEYVGSDRFNLAFMRHTGKWVTTSYGLTLDECLKWIRDDGFYHPS